MNNGLLLDDQQIDVKIHQSTQSTILFPCTHLLLLVTLLYTLPPQWRRARLSPTHVHTWPILWLTTEIISTQPTSSTTTGTDGTDGTDWMDPPLPVLPRTPVVREKNDHAYRAPSLSSLPPIPVTCPPTSTTLCFPNSTLQPPTSIPSATELFGAKITRSRLSHHRSGK